MILPNWASFDRQEAFNHFCVALPKIAKGINFNDAEFESWYKHPDPEKNYPSVCNKLTPFQRILVLMVFRPERVQSALI